MALVWFQCCNLCRMAGNVEGIEYWEKKNSVLC